MGIYTTWDITAKLIVPYQAEELQGMLDRYECDWYLEDYVYYGSFDTISVHAEEDIEHVMREFSEKHPNIVIEVFFRPEYNSVPDKWLIQAGKVRRFEMTLSEESVKVIKKWNKEMRKYANRVKRQNDGKPIVVDRVPAHDAQMDEEGDE